MRSSQPTGVTQVSIQASSACAGTADCTITLECFGSMPAARKSRRSPRILARSSAGSWWHGDGVQIDDAEDALVVVLDLHPVLERAQIISDVQIAG